MSQLREFARRKADFDKLNVRVVAISVDPQEDAKTVWEMSGNKQFTILSDPGAKVIRAYGLRHENGAAGHDIAIRATVLIDANGKELWRRVSATVPDIPTADEIVGRIKASLGK